MHCIKTLLFALCLALSLALLAGCQAEPANFTSRDEITVTATTQWQQLDTLEEMQNLVSGLTPGNMDSVDLALQKDDAFYFTIIESENPDNFNSFLKLIELSKAFLADSGTEAELLATLRTSGYSEPAIAIFRQAWQTEDFTYEMEKLFYQDLLAASALAKFQENNKNFTLINQEEIDLFYKLAHLLEYQYTNSDDIDLHFYEVYIRAGNTTYTMTAWCKEKDFAKAKDELKSLITAATIPDGE